MGDAARVLQLAGGGSGGGGEERPLVPQSEDAEASELSPAGRHQVEHVVAQLRAVHCRHQS